MENRRIKTQIDDCSKKFWQGSQLKGMRSSDIRATKTAKASIYLAKLSNAF